MEYSFCFINFTDKTDTIPNKDTTDDTITMDLLRILDAKPEPQIVDTNHFSIDPIYQNSNIYKIATPMSDFQKELIDQIVSLHYSDILRFFEKLDSESWENLSNNRKEIIITSLETLLKNAKLVCLHPYLLINHFFPKSLTTRDLPNRLAETSGKFQILNNILTQLDSIYNPIDKHDRSMLGKEIDIAIIVRSGKAMDLVDALCIGHRCTLKRYAGIKLRDSSANQKKNLNLNLNIHLFPSNFADMNEKEAAANLENYKKKMKFIILFDSDIDTSHPFMTNLSSSYSTKFFELIPIYSVEHIEHYYKGITQSRGVEEYLRPVTAAIVVMRDRVGQLPSNLKPAYTKNLSYIKEYLADSLNVKWPLPDLPSIGNFTSKDVERSLLTEVKFNFDNEEILKEEEESRPSVQDSLNTNFGGKTKMIGHIIQPRFSKKNPIVKNYYDKKRLEKDYLMNPLNKDYENLTGISKQINQGEVLTHTLIYHFDASIKKTINMNEQVQSFNEFSDVRLKNFQVMIEAFEKFDKEYRDKETKSAEIDSSIDELTALTDKTKAEINEYESKIDEYNHSGNMDEDRQKFIANDIAKYQLLEEIAKIEQRLESSNNDNKYMDEEIKRAGNSIIESQAVLEKQNDVNATLLAKIEELKQDTSKVDEESAKLKNMETDLKKLKSEAAETKLKMESMMSSLREVGHRSRHSNYLSRKM